MRYGQVPLRATPHQITYFAEKNLYPLIVSVPVSWVALLLYCQVTICLRMLWGQMRNIPFVSNELNFILCWFTSWNYMYVCVFIYIWETIIRIFINDFVFTWSVVHTLLHGGTGVNLIINALEIQNWFQSRFNALD